MPFILAILFVIINVVLVLRIAFNDYDLYVLPQSQQVVLTRNGRTHAFPVGAFMPFRLRSAGLLSSRKTGFHYYILELAGQKFRIRFYTNPKVFQSVFSTTREIVGEVAKQLRAVISSKMRQQA
ncbi:MAG: hypothetical protein EOO01_19830 [Chitinophagaceae bacterium]|nr:MAG: hypothetical protein EOO01_19830 [Chitinophagaceae bacterium]